MPSKSPSETDQTRSEASSEGTPPTTADDVGQSVRVLHVDDNASLLELAATFLEQVNDEFSVVTETSARDGLDQLNTAQIDCIVSDYQMPGMDGLEFLAAVREAHPDLPFILFTGQGSEEVASDALSAGATDYLQKGTGSEQYELLANRITNAVEGSRARDRAAYLERIRRIVRDVNQALVRATTRQEIETRMCEIISEPDSVQFVVFSGVDPETGRVEARTWAGVDGGGTFLDAVDITVGEHTDGPQTPHERAVHERKIAAAQDIQEDPAFDPWREAVTASGFHALTVVPIDYEGTLYGLLALYGARPPPIENARDLLDELGGDIAHALYAIDTQRELEKSEARYRNLAETASDAILRIDETSTITYANPATEDLFGYKQAELEGTALPELMPERLRDQHYAGIERYLRTGERQVDWSGVELPGQHKDGTEIPLSITFGEFEADGQHFFTGFIRNVTERKRQREALREEKERFRSMVQEVEDYAIFMLDADGHVASWNAGARQIKGYERDEILGEHITSFYPDEAVETGVPDQLLEQARAAGRVEDEGWRVRKDGSQFWANVVITALHDDDGDVRGFTKVTRDMTDRREYQQELERQTEQIEELLRIVAHDLQNPISVAQGNLELARESGEATHFETVETALDRVAAIINEILDVSQAGILVSDPSPVALADVADQAWALIETDNTTLVMDELGTVEADAVQLQSIFENLFQNAVTHGGEVTVTVGTLENGFYVADDGPGIPAEDQEKVLEYGYSTRDSGVGFGLGIVKTIVEAHGWSIAVTESADGGARIEIEDSATVE